jgi:two-component system phosphate regulon sensor histidine kinase PhoR
MSVDHEGTSMIFLLVFIVSVFILYIIWNGWHDRRKLRFLRSMTHFFQELEYNGAGERFQPQDIPPSFETAVRALNSASEAMNGKLEYMRLLQDRLKVILDNMSNPVILVDAKGSISYINPNGVAIFGESRIDLIGKSHWRVGRDNSMSEWIDRVLDGEEVGKLEIEFPATAGQALKPMIMEMTIVPDRNENVIHGAIVLLHDITERKEMEKMRKEFVANVSHELRTPLTAIQGYAETLLGGAIHDTETAQDFLKVIYDESIRLHKMVNDLLEISKLEHQKATISMEPVQMETIISNVIRTIRLQAEAKSIDIEWENGVHLPVRGDADLLTQLLLNLVSNAIKYTPAGGKVSIYGETGGAKVWIRISDTGIGMAEEHLSRIFERFYRVEASRNMASGGRGLGLSIVKHITQIHKGEIRVESKPGQGTTFLVALPMDMSASTSNICE